MSEQTSSEQSLRRKFMDSPEGQSQLARIALGELAESWRRRSRSRPYQGADCAELRANLRAAADEAEELARGLGDGSFTVDHTSEGTRS